MVQAPNQGASRPAAAVSAPRDAAPTAAAAWATPRRSSRGSGCAVASVATHTVRAMTTAELRALDRSAVWHPFTQQQGWMDEDAPIIERGEGCTLYDTD